MWGYAIAAVAGILWSNSAKPKTRVTRSMVIGSKSGVHWTVEYLDDFGLMIVFQGVSRGTFKRTPQGWRLGKAQGDPKVITIMKGDFE